MTDAHPLSQSLVFEFLDANCQNYHAYWDQRLKEGSVDDYVFCGKGSPGVCYQIFLFFFLSSWVGLLVAPVGALL